MSDLVEFLHLNEWEDRGGGLYRIVEPYGVWRYLLVDGDLYAACPAYAYGPDAEDLEAFEAEVRRWLTMEIERQRLPECIVPGCGEKAPMVFVAAENGRIAGREVRPGDEIRTCPPHGADIYRAQGQYGVNHLADWLREDAMVDVLDAFDLANDPLHAQEIWQQRARMLRLRWGP